MIHMREVTKIYPNKVVALDKVNIDINKGEFVFIVGQSGAGKSTFIKLLMREELPTSGDILVNGKNVVKMKSSEVPYLRRGLGVIFQDYRLLPDKTVFENVAFAMQVIEAPRRLMQRSVNTVLDIVGLSSKYKNFPSELSGGEQQRVAIARAIVNDPALDGQSRSRNELGHHGHLQTNQRVGDDDSDGDARQDDRRCDEVESDRDRGRQDRSRRGARHVLIDEKQLNFFPCYDKMKNH